MQSSSLSDKQRNRHSTQDLGLERIRRIATQEGARALNDAELLALVLGGTTGGESPLVHALSLLTELGGLAAIARSQVGGLRMIPGLGMAQAGRLVAACELGRRAVQDSVRIRPRQLLSKEAVVAWAQPRLVGLDHEEVWVLCVDAQSMLKSTWQVGRGGVHGCGLLARDILTPVIRDAASGFILVHNHPSGDPTPSREDIELTRGLSAAATAVCVPLLDHVVVARDGCRSFFELGLL